MLFNSYEFILLFLPITLFIFYKISEIKNKELPIIWLVVASLFFYGWWNPPYLILLLISIGVNYALGQFLIQAHLSEKEAQGKLLLAVGILFNLGLIGYYKYSNFFIDNINSIAGTSIFLSQIILPLGISFYTFQQISYLIDSLEGETKGYRFLDYCLFVSFFPQLIAGPIVTHQEMLPQFSKRNFFKFNGEHLVVGLTIFCMGLFKKVVLADQIALFSTPIFNAAGQDIPLTFVEAWVGALAYTLQIYFDFSGYSDMAIGAARMFGVKLPLNFNSPYKAYSIIDFWGRWHMTLTRFLTRYLYNPITLFMSRRRIKQGKNLIKRGIGSPAAFLELVALPTIVTMFLAGLWHGAGWQYIVFGLLHGFYLSINHGWRMLRKSMGHNLKQSNWWGRSIGQSITFIAVVIAMVFFRAPNVGDAMVVLNSMAGLNGVSFSDGAMFSNGLLADPANGILLIAGLLTIALCFPNTHQWMAKYAPALGFSHDKPKHQPKWVNLLWRNLQWTPTQPWAAVTAAAAVASFLGLAQVSEFIYFQF